MNVVERAMERIRRDGWKQGGFGKPGGPMCIAGAVMAEANDEASDDWQDSERIYNRGLLAVAREIGCTRTSVPDFNDNPATSLEDVLLVMKTASARLDESGSAATALLFCTLLFGLAVVGLAALVVNVAPSLALR